MKVLGLQISNFYLDHRLASIEKAKLNNFMKCYAWWKISIPAIYKVYWVYW